MFRLLRDTLPLHYLPSGSKFNILPVCPRGEMASANREGRRDCDNLGQSGRRGIT
jgi:hypothetical protein